MVLHSQITNKIVEEIRYVNYNNKFLSSKGKYNPTIGICLRIAILKSSSISKLHWSEFLQYRRIHHLSCAT